MKTGKHIIAVFAICFFHCVPAGADIYQYTDESGVLHFTNVGIDGKKKYKKLKSEPAIPQQETKTIPALASYQQSNSSSGIPSAYLDIIDAACDRHGVDPSLVHAVVKVESDFNPYALSRKGAMGLMQLMPQTAVEMNVKNSFNPYDNIDGGVKYLRYLIDRYEGNLSLVLSAYNAGETAVKRWGTIPPFKETQNYVKKVLKLYNGKESAVVPRYTIYIGYGSDGALLFTDNPSNHKDKTLRRKTAKRL